MDQLQGFPGQAGSPGVRREIGRNYGKFDAIGVIAVRFVEQVVFEIDRLDPGVSHLITGAGPGGEKQAAQNKRHDKQVLAEISCHCFVIALNAVFMC